MKLILTILILLSVMGSANAQDKKPFKYYGSLVWEDIISHGDMSKPEPRLPDNSPIKTDTVLWKEDTLFITGYGPWECGHRKVIFKKRAQ